MRKHHIILILLLISFGSCVHEPFEAFIPEQRLDSIVFFEPDSSMNTIEIDSSIGSWLSSYYTEFRGFNLQFGIHQETDFKCLRIYVDHPQGRSVSTRMESMGQNRIGSFDSVYSDTVRLINEKLTWVKKAVSLSRFEQYQGSFSSTKSESYKYDFLPLSIVVDSNNIYYGWVQLSNGDANSVYSNCCQTGVLGYALNYRPNRPIREGQKE